MVGAVDDLANRRLGLRSVLGVGGANAHGLGHVLARHGNHGAGHGGGEQHALTLLGQVAENLLQRGLETQVQHFVGLVEDHDLDLLEVQEALLVQVDDAAGGAHGHFQAAAQQLSLRLNRHATVEGCDAGVAQLRSNRQVLTHLNSKLAGLNQNQRLRRAGVRQISPTLIVAADHTLNGGQTKAEGLTGTGLRLTNDVLARQSHGKSQLLDGEGGGNANRREGVANILANAEVGEGLCSLSGFLRVRFSHWTVSFYPCSGCVSPRNGGVPASAPMVEAVTGGRRKPAAGNSYAGNSYRDAACTHGYYSWFIHDEKAVQPRGLERGTTGHSLNPSILTRICLRRTPDRLWCAPVMGDIPPQNRVPRSFCAGGLKRKPPHPARRNRTAHTARLRIVTDAGESSS